MVSEEVVLKEEWSLVRLLFIPGFLYTLCSENSLGIEDEGGTLAEMSAVEISHCSCHGVVRRCMI